MLAGIAARGVPVYGLAHRDEEARARRWLVFYGNPFRAVAHDASGSGLDFLASGGVPQTYVVDREIWP